MTPPSGRTETELKPAEIVAEALRQYDASPLPPSAATVAAALEVDPAAIERHFPTRTALVQASVEAAWNESVAELLELVPKPLEADPEMVLVAIGVATRRVWCRHFRLAPYLAASPAENDFLERSVGLMTALFGQLVDDPEQAAAGFHAYSAFMIGAVLFAASRRLADEQLGLGAEGGGRDGAGARGDDARSRADDARSQANAAEAEDPIRAALDRVVALGNADPAGDEELFVRGLRRLVASLIAV